MKPLFKASTQFSLLPRGLWPLFFQISLRCRSRHASSLDSALRFGPDRSVRIISDTPTSAPAPSVAHFAFCSLMRQPEQADKGLESAGKHTRNSPLSSINQWVGTLLFELLINLLQGCPRSVHPRQASSPAKLLQGTAPGSPDYYSLCCNSNANRARNGSNIGHRCRKCCKSSTSPRHCSILATVVLPQEYAIKYCRRICRI